MIAPIHYHITNGREPTAYAYSTKWPEMITSFRTAFPEIHMTVEDQIAEGDKVMSRWSGRGTHKGEFRALPPTGLPVTFQGMSVARVVDGKIVEAWGSWDTLGVMHQLGLITVMAPIPEGV